jgi:hypothetical protein
MTWTKSAIRLARKADLVPLLVERGYRLYPLPNGNFRILPDPDDPNAPAGVIVKESFWTWSEKNIAGNAIDFFTLVEGKTFNQAMEIITADRQYDHSEHKIREDHGNDAKTVR